MRTRLNRNTIPKIVIASSAPKVVTTSTNFVIYRRYSIQNPSLVWEIPHNQNTDKFSAVLRDLEGNQFYAKIIKIDKNKFNVILTEATSGTVDVVFELSDMADIEIV
jgi:hypothetical protein